MTARPRGLSAALAAGCLLPLALPATTASAAMPTRPFLSELHYDNVGTDTGEFVEVQLPAGTSTAGWSIALYNGNGGAVYDTLPVPATTAPADAPAAVAVDAAGLQNGSPDGLALLDASGAVVELLSYEGVLTAASGPAAGRTSTDIGQAEDGTAPLGSSLSRTYDDATDAYVWRPPSASTRGTVNPAPSGGSGPAEPPAPELCATPATHEVGQVQGPGASSPLADRQVVVRGTVVADLPGLSGFHLQDPDGDGDPATSDAVFVASPVAVSLGDTVAVAGPATESFGQTQVGRPASAGPPAVGAEPARAQVCAAGTVADLPAAAALDLPAAAALALPAAAAARERLEGMLVAPVDRLTVSEVFGLTRFGELLLSEGGLLVQPTELARPGPAATAVAAQNALRQIVLDDASSARTSLTARPYLSRTTPVRVGDELALVEPLVLGFGFGSWRLQPADGTADGVLTPSNTRPAAPDPVGGDVTVGAFNVLNYFRTPPPTGRGARDKAGLDRQAAKVVAAIGALDADVVALQEIEDSDSTGLTPGNADTVLADLVRRLNAAAGDDRWAHPAFPSELLAVDRDVIRNAVIYRRDVVEPVGPSVGLVDEASFDNAREPIAQTFTKDGDAFTVVANHFKSKSGTGTGANADTGQGSFNADRVDQARAVAAFTDRLRQQTGDQDVLVLGDLNAYTREDPVEVLRDAGFTDLGERLDAGRYSYVFGGLSGSLDHALATAPLTAKVTGLAHWGINSGESAAYQYDGDPALYAADPYRSSDHDPLVLGIDLAERCAGLVPTLVGTPGPDTLTGTAGRDVVMGLGGDDVLAGGNGDDVLCGGAGDDVVRGGNGRDALLGGFGADALLGGNGDDRLLGGPCTDRLNGGRGDDTAAQDGPAS